MNLVVYAVTRQIAVWLSYLRLNRLQLTSLEGQLSFVKSRRWFTRILIPLGNLLMRTGSCQSEVLTEAEWHDWERRISEENKPYLAMFSSSDFGPSLHAVLLSEEHTPAEKLESIQLALRSLHQLHQRTILWDDGERRLLSHGDATCRNVCINLHGNTATWIDFDTRHRREISAVVRFSDDYRALAFSAAVSLEETQYLQLADLCWQNMNRDVARRFRLLLDNTLRQATLFQLAQAPLKLQQLHRLCDAFQSTQPD